MRKFLPVLILLALAAPAVADVTGNDIKCVADTTLSFTTGLKQAGPHFVDFAQDGNAAVQLVWFKKPGTGRGSGDIVRSLLVFLRDYTPPTSLYFPTGPDSGDVDLVTASEMLIRR
jgi:hypothetical protein